MSRHVPVLLNEVLESLNLKAGMKVIDGTLGDAGHSEKILEAIGPTGKLLGIDADPESLLRAKQFLHKFEKQVVLVRDNFVNLQKIVSENNFGLADAILLDLGWSSPQFKERGRGFSFENDEPLDMRYAGSQESGAHTQTAAEIVNKYDFDDLYRIFRQFGEEDLSREIAEAILEARKIKPIERTGQLTEIILQVYRKKLGTEKEVPWIGGLHPATKVFQALRIEVNDELKVLRDVLPQAVAVLAEHGRLAVITFHSGEDRVVKHYFKSLEGKSISLVNKKPIVGSPEECEENPRARSAKLRVIEKL